MKTASDHHDARRARPFRARLSGGDEQLLPLLVVVVVVILALGCFALPSKCRAKQTAAADRPADFVA